MDLEKLTQDATVARVLAVAAADATPDNGTCNLDTTMFELARGDKVDRVVSAFDRAGVMAYRSGKRGRTLMLSARGVIGQANKNAHANQALYDSLKRSGWPVRAWYQMD